MTGILIVEKITNRLIITFHIDLTLQIVIPVSLKRALHQFARFNAIVYLYGGKVARVQFFFIIFKRNVVPFRDLVLDAFRVSQAVNVIFN